MGATFKIKDPDKFVEMISFQGETLRSFSKRIGISETAFSRYINQNRRLRPTTAKKIADGLNKSIGDIFLP